MVLAIAAGAAEPAIEPPECIQPPDGVCVTQSRTQTHMTSPGASTATSAAHGWLGSSLCAWPAAEFDLAHLFGSQIDLLQGA